jgi:molybdate transport system regulatory protein
MYLRKLTQWSVGPHGAKVPTTAVSRRNKDALVEVHEAIYQLGGEANVLSSEQFTRGQGMRTSNDCADIRLRVMLAPEIPLGPGKAQLLEGIKETGSISAAGRRMGMSYKRAWYLVEALNSHFHAAMVEATKGGKSGGGAKLTPLGIEVLAAYREMEEAAARAVAPILRRLRRKSGPARAG